MKNRARILQHFRTSSDGLQKWQNARLLFALTKKLRQSALNLVLLLQTIQEKFFLGRSDFTHEVRVKRKWYASDHFLLLDMGVREEEGIPFSESILIFTAIDSRKEFAISHRKS